jgi:Ni/Co efflux regulator RcnB
MIVKLILTRRLVALAIATLFVGGSGFARDHDNGRHEDKERRHADHDHQREQQERHEDRREHEEVRAGAYFDDRHREVARAYYRRHYGRGGCPPGLAKKHNGCLPPGQARNWAVGQPLPRDVIVYSIPQPLIVQLPRAPLGYRYVRVANDIVLLSLESAIVVDVIAGLLN